MSKKITVIGGAGFIGTYLCKALSNIQQDFEIIDLKISKKFSEKSKIGDVRDIESLRQTVTGDVVIFLAAAHRDDIFNKMEYRLTNVNGAENVAKVCEEKKISKIIFTSSVAVYGFPKIETDENGEINPFNEYGRSKFEAEEKLRNWQRARNTQLIIVRPTVIFGEGNRGNVFNLFNQIALRRFIMIGEGKNKKSMAYVRNVAAFLQKCIASKRKYCVYNYVDTPNCTMNELVLYLRYKLLGKSGVGIRLPYWLGLTLGYFADLASLILRKNLSISSIRVKKFASSSEFNSNKENLDGFIPPFSLFEGIDKTLQSEFISPDPQREIFFTE